MSAAAFFQHTVAGPAIFAGIGLHTGAHVRVAIRPAAPGAGITFVRTDVREGDNAVHVSPQAVTKTQLGTVIENASGVKVSTIEHLMAAFAALGVEGDLEREFELVGRQQAPWSR